MIDIKDTKECCGCAACEQACPKQCISLKEDSEGFLYPKVDESVCVNCGLCVKVCPELTPFDNPKLTNVYAAINPDEEVRRTSSSGGIFSMLSEQTIAQGGVVFGARFDENWQVVIDSAENVEDTISFRGSKYVQAQVGDSYIRCKKYLDKERKVLFCGTQCQIAGLLHFLRKPYPNLLTVDFICHGVPSPAVWKRYLEEVVTAGKHAIYDIHFRNKKTGWKRYSFQMEFDKDENDVTLASEVKDNPYMKAFLSNLILRPSCYNCPAKDGKSNSDITIADFWGIQNVSPSMNDDRGTSLIVVHTAKGLDALPFDDMKYEEVPIDSLCFNPSYSKSSTSHPRRQEFFAAFNSTNDLHKLIDHSLRPSFRQRLANYKYPLRCLKTNFINILNSGNVSKTNRVGCISDCQFIIGNHTSDSFHLKAISFRDKHKGWKSYRILFTLKLDK